MTATQNYSNHVRWFPLFHFVISPLLLAGLIYLIVRLVQEPSWDRAVWVGFAFVIILVSLSARVQALKAQDRIIRLEETLRYRELLEPGLARRAMNLEPKTLIPLRFASDEELPDLVTQVLDGKIKTSKEIKAAVKNWRADYLRV
ncbi:MAG: DUF6526 family protein [Pyrinomonadaceae bacterium]